VAGQRAPALRFGDPRVQALADALAATVHTLPGTVTNQSLRAKVTQLPGQPHTSAQMSYDLRRLRLKGLLERLEGTHTYRITPAGQRVAIFYTKVHNRLLVPLLAADQPPAPPELRRALRTIDRHVEAAIDHARLPRAT
jgi:predicted MarR family transcription regulator